MPSPAVTKLEALPLTPLQSGSNSASSSRPSSRRGSAAASSISIPAFRKQSHGAHTSNNPGRPSLASLGVTPSTSVLSSSSASAIVSPGGSGVNNNQERKSSSSSTAFLGKSSDITASPVTSSNLRIGEGQSPIVGSPVQVNSSQDGKQDYQKQVEEAVDEEQMLSSSLHSESALDDDDDDETDDERVLSQHTNANTKANSASTDGMVIEEEDDDKEDDDGKDEIDGMLRTGNERFRRGSRRLSRLSSTLGEGITAHWKRSSPSIAMTTSTSKDESNSADAALSRAMSQAQEAQKAPPPAPPSSHPQSITSAQEQQSTTRKEQSPSSTSKSPQRVQPHAADLPAGLKPIKKKSKALANSAIGTGEIEEVLSPIEQAKKSAAYRAVDVHVKPHHRVIGIGSGSTVPYVVDRLLEQGEEANRKRWFVPTGFQSKELIVNAGLKLGDVDQFPVIDVTIDGADDVDWALNAIKGGGACHLREKVLAEAAEEFVIVADYRKNNMLLGKSWKQGVPIETPPFAYSKVFDNLERIPGCMVAQLRMGKAKAGPLVTDNGNFVIDAPFDEAHMREPESLLVKIKMLTGVVEVGLFCGMARAAYFGNADGSVTVRWSDGQEETLKEGETAKIKAEDIDENYRPTDILLTWQDPTALQTDEQSVASQTSLSALQPQQPHVQENGQDAEMSKLKQKLEQLRMTST